MSTDTITSLAPVATVDDFTRTHILNCPDGKASTQAWITEARIEGLEVEALCGYRWVPERDPEKYSVCEACVGAANIIIAEVNRGQ